MKQEQVIILSHLKFNPQNLTLNYLLYNYICLILSFK
jgi:hypothetical protein